MLWLDLHANMPSVFRYLEKTIMVYLVKSSASTQHSHVYYELCNPEVAMLLGNLN